MNMVKFSTLTPGQFRWCPTNGESYFIIAVCDERCYCHWRGQQVKRNFRSKPQTDLTIDGYAWFNNTFINCHAVEWHVMLP